MTPPRPRAGHSAPEPPPRKAGRHACHWVGHTNVWGNKSNLKPAPALCVSKRVRAHLAYGWVFFSVFSLFVFLPVIYDTDRRTTDASAQEHIRQGNDGRWPPLSVCSIKGRGKLFVASWSGSVRSHTWHRAFCSIVWIEFDVTRILVYKIYVVSLFACVIIC